LQPQHISCLPPLRVEIRGAHDDARKALSFPEAEDRELGVQYRCSIVMLMDGGRGGTRATSIENLRGAFDSTDHRKAVVLRVAELALLVTLVVVGTTTVERNLVRDDAESGVGRDGGKACFQKPMRVNLHGSKQDGRQFGRRLQDITECQPTS